MPQLGSASHGKDLSSFCYTVVNRHAPYVCVTTLRTTTCAIKECAIKDCASKECAIKDCASAVVGCGKGNKLWRG